MDASNSSITSVIKPIQYEIDSIIEAMRSISPAEKGFLVQSVWKYLIYTELLKTIYTQINNFPVHVELNKAEQDIICFVENNKDIIINEFSDRFENVVRDLLNSDTSEESRNKEYRIRVSEVLHESVLSRIKHSLAEYCGSKERIIVLIDNLDKSWVNGADLNLVSSFLFGLLDVGENIIRDFSRDSNWNKNRDTVLLLTSGAPTEQNQIPIQWYNVFGQLGWKSLGMVLGTGKTEEARELGASIK